ncbi:MAG: ATP-dependent DNA helicase [Thermoplasmatota archaeon]
MVAYCPTCRGIMRPAGKSMQCIACTQRARGQPEQKSLGGGAFDAPLAPRPPAWKAHTGGAPDPRLGLFPHDAIREGQIRLLRDAKLAIEAGRHLVAHAPTGIGKTAAVLAPALEAALRGGKTVMFLTNRQAQHHIAVETLRTIQERRGARFAVVDLVSKRDMCLRREAAEMHPSRFPDFCARETRTKNCRFIREVDSETMRRAAGGILHVEEFMGVARDAQICPHILAMAAAREAHVVIADYNHLFSDLREASLERLGIRLGDLILVVDEAHNLAERIRTAHSHRVTPFLLDMVAGEARSQRATAVQADVEALRRALEGLTAGKGSSGQALLSIEELHRAFEGERNRLAVGTVRTLANFLTDLLALVRQLQKEGDGPVQSQALAAALEDWGRFGEGAVRSLSWQAGEGIHLNLRLLDPSIPARAVFAGVQSSILMSGTLRPPEMVADLLGLEAARTLCRTYVSPFPPGNRHVVVAKGVTTRMESRTPELWLRLARDVEGVAGAAQGNVAVFFPSYATLGKLREVLPDTGRELIVEDPQWTKSERDQVVDRMEGARKRAGALLLGVLGGSLAEGVDFPGNLLAAIMVVGVPLAPPDLEVDEAIRYFERRHPGRGREYAYIVPAMNRVLQAMGRGIRSGTDRCAIVLWDERYLAPPYRHLLPADANPVASADPVAAVTPFLALPEA